VPVPPLRFSRCSWFTARSRNRAETTGDAAKCSRGRWVET
jgi:hypothetical protein